MSTESPQLPPKPEVALALLQTASSVYVHLDPRGEDVHVPNWFKKQPQLVLQVGLNMAVPIPDLDVGHGAISCTLSFNRRAEFCKIPWEAIYGLVGEDGRGMIWPESVPSEVAASAQGRSPVAKAPEAKRPKLRLAHSVSPVDSEEVPAEVSSLESASDLSDQKVDIEAALEAVSTKIEEKNKDSVDTAALVAQKKVASSGKKELPSYLRVVK